MPSLRELREFNYFNEVDHCILAGTASLYMLKGIPIKSQEVALHRTMTFGNVSFTDLACCLFEPFGYSSGNTDASDSDLRSRCNVNIFLRLFKISPERWQAGVAGKI